MEQIIESFLNGQNQQMIDQINEQFKFMEDFVQAIQDEEMLNDKQKITILGRVLKANA